MKDERERKADAHFMCSDSERATFEAGIKLGTIYHQFVGVPLNTDNVETLERAMEAGSMVQPFVDSVKVRIDRTKLREKVNEFGYVSLTGDMLDVSIVVKYNDTVVEAAMKFVKEMNYPLMFVSRIVKGGKDAAHS
ncbi:MAG: dihydroneopterin aldolase family protein [Thermoplasmata archaeon]|nr:dihydroneopterin aldolase family protein [Thermoplasmata archaeon]MBU1157963.1 dihydroneopterin aldolase family protein [Candidatus Thermoplasmatota archaeon]TFG70772.1 MAG: dihydroneopterin aldolase [Methanomassiliicoccus sp.]